MSDLPTKAELNEQSANPDIWTVLKVLGWVIMVAGVIGGIVIIVQMAPETDILGDPVEPANPLRWVFGISAIFSSIVSGCVLLGLGSLVENVHKIKEKMNA